MGPELVDNMRLKVRGWGLGSNSRAPANWSVRNSMGTKWVESYLTTTNSWKSESYKMIKTHSHCKTPIALRCQF